MKAGFFNRTIGHVRAVDNVSFSIRRGETLGLVGESGCGKSTTGRTILRLIEATSGEVRFEGVNLLALDDEGMRRMRKEIQMIFQDPYASLDPRMTVADAVGEPLIIHDIVQGKKARDEQVGKILSNVGLGPEAMRRYPHEFSGGQRQRIGIARALVVHPKLIIADEPVSALDVSIQAQVINLIQDLQKEFGLTYLLIAHDLSVIKHISDRIAVMYLGMIVEIADKQTLFAEPLHPYTQGLLSAVPVPDPTRRRHKVILEGDVPSPINPPSGCYFHPRCRLAQDVCRHKKPDLKEYASGHFAACNLLE
ncbi:MAG: ATP-binding cassette domain-containing protein [Anaerolineales bacterium]|nr:ATP-binding cassette domain-containing protein [Anaerolineales bacterium]